MEIGNPVVFPAPQLYRSNVVMRRVMGNDNRIVERPCLVSESGRYYEIGRFIRETIFGHINHALALASTQVGDILVRLNPLTNIAIKVYLKSKLRELQGKTQENPFKEMSANEFIRNSGGHINFIQHIECCTDNDRVYSIMEFCDGGELYDIVETSGVLSEGLARFYFRQIVHGLQYLHSLPISHRDMSLENVLVSRNGVCKIIDLGMCLRVSRNDRGLVLPMYSQGPCGKKNYIAPEVLENISPFQPLLVDIWALGIMLFILVTGVPPMDVASRLDSRYLMILNGRLQNLLDQWGITLTPAVVDLIAIILKPQPHLRPSLENILAHPWMQLADVPPTTMEDEATLGS